MLMSLLLMIPGYLPSNDLDRGRRVVAELARRQDRADRKLPEYGDCFAVFHLALEHRERAWEMAGWRGAPAADAGEADPNNPASSALPWHLKAFVLADDEFAAVQSIAKDTRSVFIVVRLTERR